MNFLYRATYCTGLMLLFDLIWDETRWKWKASSCQEYWTQDTCQAWTACQSSATYWTTTDYPSQSYICTSHSLAPRLYKPEIPGFHSQQLPAFHFRFSLTVSNPSLLTKARYKDRCFCLPFTVFIKAFHSYGISCMPLFPCLQCLGTAQLWCAYLSSCLQFFLWLSFTTFVPHVCNHVPRLTGTWKLTPHRLSARDIYIAYS